MKSPSPTILEFMGRFSSEDVIYSCHEEDEIQFEYKDEEARVPNGEACGVIASDGFIYCFSDIQISELTHEQWLVIEEKNKSDTEEEDSEYD